MGIERLVALCTPIIDLMGVKESSVCSLFGGGEEMIFLGSTLLVGSSADPATFLTNLVVELKNC